MFSPHLDWRREPLRARVAERIRLPVVVDNDANTMALAECRFGAGRGHRFVLCVTLGTGIGGALVLDNRVYRGANGMAGEFGHMQVVPDGHRCECGNRGCWEQYASGNALVRDARELVRSSTRRWPISSARSSTATRTPSRARRSPRQPATVTRCRSSCSPTSGAGSGVGLAGMAAAFDPGCIIIGGGLSEAGDLLIGPTRQAFSRSLTGRGHRDRARDRPGGARPERRLHRRRRHGAFGRSPLAPRTGAQLSPHGAAPSPPVRASGAHRHGVTCAPHSPAR